MDHVEFMRDLETRYKKRSALRDRSQYKIFYSSVRPAKILVLGINPGGNPAEIMPDGMNLKNSSDGLKRGSASDGFYENDEHDLLDCSWRENNIVKLLIPLVGGKREAIRRHVVKTNVAFRRSSKTAGFDIECAKVEAAPFLAEIIEFVRPKLIILAGVKLDEFTRRFCSSSREVGDRLVDPRVKQTVFRAAVVILQRGAHKAIAVQVAHASQFSWTYDKYQVAKTIERVHEVLGETLVAVDPGEEPFDDPASG